MLDHLIVVFLLLLYLPMLLKACFLKSSHEILAEQRAVGESTRSAMTVVTLVLLGLLQWICFRGELSIMALLLYAIILYELVMGAMTLASPEKVFAFAESRVSLVKVPLLFELVYFSALAVSIFLPVSVSHADDDTYARFSVGSEAFEMKNMTFSCEPIGEGDNHFVELRPDRIKNGSNDFPDGTIQWQMDLKDRNEVFDREINLAKQARNANIYFALTADSAVIPAQFPPRTRITVTRIDEDYVEGSFKARAMSRSSGTSAKLKRVAVSGTFRARLIR